MVEEAYVPARGDLIWLSFSPQAGREQSGRRPALVLSAKSYNEKAMLCVVCPITSQQKNYPFEETLPEDIQIRGVVLADHVKSLDWMERKAKFICTVSEEVVSKIAVKTGRLLG